MSENNIGNYKGVMLCNRPNQEVNTSNKPAPFISRVNPADPVGFSLPAKEIRREAKPRPKSILVRHRKWLAMVQEHRAQVTKQEEEKKAAQVKKKAKFAKAMEKQRQTIANSEASETPARSEQHHKEKKLIENFDKPRWALTAEENEQREEAEVSELLDFVDNLDYDQYVEDLEFKMALEIVKSKVNELVEKNPEIKDAPARSERPLTADSQRSAQSVQSIQSMRSHLAGKSRQPDGESVRHDDDWDTQSNTQNRKMNTMAKSIADKILKEYPFLKNVHSNASIRHLMEKHIDETVTSKHPTIAMVKERLCAKDVVDASNLPYLHRNPAV